MQFCLLFTEFIQFIFEFSVDKHYLAKLNILHIGVGNFSSK